MPVIENYSLQAVNTFGVNQSARFFANVENEEELKDLLVRFQNPYILGGGSNILLTQDLDRLVIRNGIQGKTILDENEEHVWIEASSGENWHGFVQWAVSHDWGGIENLSLIPGTIGAAPIQNIGAYGVELKDVLVSLNAIELGTGKSVSFKASECQFGYRDSIFKQPEYKGRYFITSIVLKLNKQAIPNTRYADVEKKLNEKSITHPSINDVHHAVIEIRQHKLPDPALIGNAGSFFKNPIISMDLFERLKSNHPQAPHYPVNESWVKLPAGWLIDQAGWKGKKQGPVGCYEKQALVIVNMGGATGQQIWSFAQMIQKDVQQKFDILLEPEINIW